MPDTIESTPDPATSALVAMALRYALTAATALGVYHGVVSDSVLSLVASSIVGVATACWALYERYAMAHHVHSAAVLSAAAGKPIQPAP